MSHSPKDEYDELMEMYRHYGNLRFATLTLFAGVVAGFLAILFNSATVLAPTVKTLLEVGGLLASLVFWAMELSAVVVWHHCAKRAAELETHLGFRILSTMPDAPRFRLLPTTYARFASLLGIAVVLGIHTHTNMTSRRSPAQQGAPADRPASASPRQAGG